MTLSEQYKATIDYMYTRLPMFQRIGSAAYKKDLTNIRALCDFLGQPQQQYKTIHVAGTNGKGSVSHMLCAIFQQKGLKTGLYVSPHYKDYRERIKVNGRYVSKRFVIEFIDKLRPIIEQVNPSFFEINVAMAFEYFRQQKVDMAIIETGLGGRLDSTNIIDPVISVITNISFDHMSMLGNTLPEIAVEKAGIIKPGRPVVIGERQTEVQEVFTRKADELSCPILFASDHFTATTASSDLRHTFFDIYKDDRILAQHAPFNLHGTYQEKNIATVLGAVQMLNYVADVYHLPVMSLLDFLHAGKDLKALTRFMGRWQLLSAHPLTICDSGHNEAGIRFIMQQLATIHYQQLHFVIGVVNDKDIQTILALLPKDAVYYFCKANVPRGLNPNELKQIASTFGLLGKSYSSVRNALKAARKHAGPDDLVFVGGSTFVVAEVI